MAVVVTTIVPVTGGCHGARHRRLWPENGLTPCTERLQLSVNDPRQGCARERADGDVHLATARGQAPPSTAALRHTSHHGIVRHGCQLALFQQLYTLSDCLLLPSLPADLALHSRGKESRLTGHKSRIPSLHDGDGQTRAHTNLPRRMFVFKHRFASCGRQTPVSAHATAALAVGARSRRPLH